MTEVYDLVYHLGVTANYTGLFSYGLCDVAVRGTARSAAVGDEMAVPGGCKAVRHQLENGGTGHLDCELHQLVGKQAPAGKAGPQASGVEISKTPAAGHPGLLAGYRPSSDSWIGRGGSSRRRR